MVEFLICDLGMIVLSDDAKGCFMIRLVTAGSTPKLRLQIKAAKLMKLNKNLTAAGENCYGWLRMVTAETEAYWTV